MYNYRYPKMWDRSKMKEMIAKTGARIVPFAMCEHQHFPSDSPDKPYRKLTWWLVSPGLYIWALLIARFCSGTHEHTPIAGKVQTVWGLINRSVEAGAYAARVCALWPMVIWAAYKVTPPSALPPLLKGHAVQADLEGLAELCSGHKENQSEEGKAGMIAGEEAPPGRCRARCLHGIQCCEPETHVGSHWYKECTTCAWILFEDSVILTQAQQELRQLDYGQRERFVCNQAD